MGSIVNCEIHEKGCSCSYCARVTWDRLKFVFPKNKGRTSHRRMSYVKKDGRQIHLSWTLPKLSYFFGFDFCSWGYGFRLKILPAPISLPNSSKALVTFCYPPVFRTKIKNVENLFWKSTLVKPEYIEIEPLLSANVETQKEIQDFMKKLSEEKIILNN